MSQTSRHGPAGLVSWSASPGGLYWSAPRLWIRYAHPARQERRGAPLPGAPYTSQQACLARTTTRAAVLERLWPREARMGRSAGRASDLLFLPDHCVIGYGTLEERGLPTQSMPLETGRCGNVAFRPSGKLSKRTWKQGKRRSLAKGSVSFLLVRVQRTKPGYGRF